MRDSATVPRPKNLLTHLKIFLIIALVVVGLVITTRPSLAQEGGQSFDSSRFGVAFTYPDGWVISDNPNLVDLLNPAESIVSIEGPLYAGVSLKLFANPTGLSLMEVASRLAAQATTTLDPPTVEVIPLEVTNSAMTAAALVRGIPSWTTDSYVLLLVEERAYLFSLNIAFLPNVEERRLYYSLALRQILNSLTFTPSEWAGDTLDMPVNVAAQTVATQFDYPVPDPSMTDWGLLQAFNNFFDNPRYNSYHAGEDWYQRGQDNPTAGESVFAAADGVVKYASFANYPGEVVIVEHRLADGAIWFSMYGHLGSRAVNQGDTVMLGQVIGTIYDWPNNSHLHFEMRNFFIKDFINGPSAALSRHTNYPPGPGYWPVGRFADNGERPPDQGWIEPYPFIEMRRPYQPTLAAAAYGRVLLQGQTVLSGTTVSLIEQPCADLAVLTETVVLSTTTLTDERGYFEVNAAVEAETGARCLQIQRDGFLRGEYASPQVGHLGSLTLLNGDVTGDNQIDIFDVSMVARHYESDTFRYDLNQDNVVDIFDISLVAGNYNQQGPLTAWQME